MPRTISVPAHAPAAPRASKRLLALRGDDHLVGQLRRGNEGAFEVIYERHVPGILSFCRHMLGSLEEAEDAVQHAFAAAHRDLLRDDREIRLKSWLYAIARNRCLSMLRARREQPDEALDADTDGLDDEVQRRADLRELVADLKDLPEDQRAALVLFELGDLSHKDVANALGCQVANVKGLVFRARSGLIERREARGAACDEIQQELATARGGVLRRGRLRHHVRACSACSNYLEQVGAQRKMMALILPVVPSVGLKNGVLAAVSVGGGASGGGGGAAGGGLLVAALPGTGATVAKVAVVGALVGGAGVAGQVGIGGLRSLPGSPPPAAPEGAAKAPRLSFSGTASADGGEPPVAAGERGTPGVETERRRKLQKAHEGAPAHGKPQDGAPPAAVPVGIGQQNPQETLDPLQVRAEPPEPPRVPASADFPAPPRLPVSADPPELPRVPVGADPPEPPRLPPSADAPQPPSVPIRAQPREVRACGLSTRLCG